MKRKKRQTEPRRLRRKRQEAFDYGKQGKRKNKLEQNMKVNQIKEKS